MTCQIRDATIDDLPQIVLLNGQIQSLHADAYPEDFQSPVDPNDVSRYFRGVLEKDRHHLLLAAKDSEIVGYLQYEIQPAGPNPFTKPVDRLFIHHVLVDADHRRAGIAKMFMDRVKEAAAVNGCQEIALDTWAANESAQAFFEAEGLEVFRLYYRMKTGSD